MARSVRARPRSKSDRDTIRKIKRRARHEANHLCRQVSHDPDLWDETPELLEYPTHEINYEARDHGVSSGFSTWAISISQELPKESRLSYVMGSLPRGSMNSHLARNLTWRDEFCTNDTNYRSRYRRASKQPKVDYKATLTKIVHDNDIHRLFNRWMVSKHVMVKWVIGYKNGAKQVEAPFFPRYEANAITLDVGPERPRMLEGVGDIDSFLKDISMRGVRGTIDVQPWLSRHVRRSTYQIGCDRHQVHEIWKNTRPNPLFHREWKEAMREFVRHYLELHGDKEQIRLALGL